MFQGLRRDCVEFATSTLSGELVCNINLAKVQEKTNNRQHGKIAIDPVTAKYLKMYIDLSYWGKLVTRRASADTLLFPKVPISNSGKCASFIDNDLIKYRKQMQSRGVKHIPICIPLHV